jgi:hypothetical protein
MKKLIFILTFVLIFCCTFFGEKNTNRNNLFANTGEKFDLKILNEWVEYIYDATIDQWYKITHFEDGTIGIEPVPYPPEDWH